MWATSGESCSGERLPASTRKPPRSKPCTPSAERWPRPTSGAQFRDAGAQSPCFREQTRRGQAELRSGAEAGVFWCGALDDEMMRSQCNIGSLALNGFREAAREL